MRAQISWLLSAALLFGAAAATAQSFPCDSVAPEVRERVRETGGCRDATPVDVAPNESAPASSVVTVTLSDGTVVRVPREIGLAIKTAPRAKTSTQSGPDAFDRPAPAPRKLEVPDVVGRSDADAGRALAAFKVDRTEKASAAPSGEVLAQQPAPSTLMLPGSTVSLQVSDGSLAGAAVTTAVTAPAAAAAASSTPTAAPDAAPASTAAPVAASEPTALPATQGRPPIAFPANAALILGAGVLLGLLFGALLMRQWLLRREPVADASAVSLMSQQPPVEIGAAGVSETGAAPEVRFAARREPGETTIVLAPRSDGDEVAIEHSSDHHA